MARYQAFSTTVIGSSHTKHGKGIEDCVASYDNPKLSLAVVAEGHGADECFRSARGAKTAAQCAIKGLHDFITDLAPRFTATLLHKASPPSHEEFAALLRSLVKHIIAQWYDHIDRHIKAEPFTAGELESAGEKYRARYEKGAGLYKAYGATLIAAAVTPKYWFGIHIGDGRLTALYPDGSFAQPVPWDEKAPPAAVFLCSDGVYDNYPVEENEQHLFKLYRTIALTFAEDGFASTCAQLKDLAHSIATRGKGDDTSIAGMVDMDGIHRAAPHWKKQIAEEEA